MELPFEGGWGPEVAVVPCTGGWLDGWVHVSSYQYVSYSCILLGLLDVLCMEWLKWRLSSGLSACWICKTTEGILMKFGVIGWSKITSLITFVWYVSSVTWISLGAPIEFYLFFFLKYGLLCKRMMHDVIVIQWGRVLAVGIKLLGS